MSGGSSEDVQVQRHPSAAKVAGALARPRAPCGAWRAARLVLDGNGAGAHPGCCCGLLDPEKRVPDRPRIRSFPISDVTPIRQLHSNSRDPDPDPDERKQGADHHIKSSGGCAVVVIPSPHIPAACREAGAGRGLAAGGMRTRT